MLGSSPSVAVDPLGAKTFESLCAQAVSLVCQQANEEFFVAGASCLTEQNRLAKPIKHPQFFRRTQLVAHTTFFHPAVCQPVFFEVFEHSDRALIRQRFSEKELRLNAGSLTYLQRTTTKSKSAALCIEVRMLLLWLH